MPKISNKEFRIRHKNLEKDFKVTVMYNQDHAFYIELPGEFKEVIHTLSESQLSTLGITKRYPTKGMKFETSPYTPIVSKSSELEVIQATKMALEFLLDKTIILKKVIIVFYNSDMTMRYNEHRYNTGHPQIGLQFGLTYAIESTAGDKKVYSTYTERNGYPEGHPDRYIRSELGLWGAAATIIDDTEENRKVLESLYSAMASLRTKLKEFTASPDAMLDFIESKVNILSLPAHEE